MTKSEFQMKRSGSNLSVRVSEIRTSFVICQDCFCSPDLSGSRVGTGKNSCFMMTRQDEGVSPAATVWAFTLIELAAVAAVLAALAMLVLPALAKGNPGSREAICLNNHRQ